MIQSRLINRESIASLLFRMIFGSYFIVTFVVTLMQVVLEYYHVKDSIQDEIKTLPSTFERGIADSIWTYNNDLLNSILIGMNEIPIVVGVKILDQDQNPIQVLGQVLDDNGNPQLITPDGEEQSVEPSQLYSLFSHQFPIHYIDEYDSSQRVGTGEIYSSTELVVERVTYGFLLILINSMIKVFALYAIFLFFVKKYLGKPLGRMAKEISDIHFDNLDNVTIQVVTPEQNELKVLEKSFNTMIQKLSEETRRIQAISQTFEKFVPQQFLQRIAAEGIENIELGKAQTETMTILFADIRSFTDLSEKMKPQELLNFLNAYLHRINHPIHKNHGFVDKFIGDAIMALFDRQNLSANDSVRAAIQMWEEIHKYNRHRHNTGYDAIKVGIGIHTGETIIGTVGSQERMDSTVLGDSVNLASRIEGLTKYYQSGIIISEQTYRLLDDTSILCRELDYVTVKGKERPEHIFEVFNGDRQEIQDLKQRSLGVYSTGLFHFHNQNWDEGIQAFEECLKIYPEDTVAQIYAQRCLNFKTNPPPSDWNHVTKMTEK